MLIFPAPVLIRPAIPSTQCAMPTIVTCKIWPIGRLKNLTVGYSLPERWISKVGLSKCRIYFSGENLFYFTKLHSDFIDPEQATTNSGNSDAYPWYKTFAFGVNLTF